MNQIKCNVVEKMWTFYNATGFATVLNSSMLIDINRQIVPLCNALIAAISEVAHELTVNWTIVHAQFALASYYCFSEKEMCQFARDGGQPWRDEACARSLVNPISQ